MIFIGLRRRNMLTMRGSSISSTANGGESDPVRVRVIRAF